MTSGTDELDHPRSAAPRGLVVVLTIGLMLAACSSGNDDASIAPTTVPTPSTTSAPVPSWTSSTSTVSPGPPPLEGTYVALGSSNAAGPGAGAFVDAACARGAQSYPRLLAENLAMDLVDATCSGATIDHVVDTPQPTGNINQAPQIDAVPADAALITVTVGGNDMAYIGTFMICNEECPPGSIDDEASRDARFAQVTEELVAMLDLLAERAPDARIVVVGYPIVIEDPTVPCAPLSLEETKFLYDVGERLQAAFLEATERTGVEYVDVYDGFRGHGGCRSPDQRWLEGADPIPDAIPWHPNASGTAAMADMTMEALTTTG